MDKDKPSVNRPYNLLFLALFITQLGKDKLKYELKCEIHPNISKFQL